MGLTERQAHAHLHQHALEEEAKLIDYFNAVEQLHNIELPKIIPKLKTDARWANVPRIHKNPSKISVARLIRGLPIHIMGCLLAKQPGAGGDATLSTLTDAPLASTDCFQHAAKALRLLSTLSDMCVPLPPLRDNGCLGPDPVFTRELIDAANLALLAVAGPEADTLVMSATSNHTFDAALGRAELVPAALRAVALVVSAQAPVERGAKSDHYNWTAVCEALFSHPRGTVLLDAAFEATRVLVRAVRAALCAPEVDGGSVYALAYSAGAAMELVTALCACPLFYHRIMLHEPSGAAPLRLVLACLAIHDAPLAAPPFARVPGSGGEGSAEGQRSVLTARPPPYLTDRGGGAAELLAARGFALLLLLGEYEGPTYLDEVFSSAGTRVLAEQLVGRAAAYVGQVLLRPPVASFPPAAGEGQMAINVLRAAELLSDDSNFRVALIPGLAPPLAQLLAHTDSGRFTSMWCLGEEAVRMSGSDADLLVNSTSRKSIELVDLYAAASKEYHARGLGVDARSLPGLPPDRLKMGRHLSLERSILTAKLLVNLHYYDDSLPPDLRDAFLNALVAAARGGARDAAGRAAATAAAASNLENLFAVAWEFGAPEALKGIELMAEVDMIQSQDLLAKVQAAAAEDAAAAAAEAAAAGASVAGGVAAATLGALGAAAAAVEGVGDPGAAPFQILGPQG